MRPFVVVLASLLFANAARADARADLLSRGVWLDEAQAKLAEEEVQALVDGLDALPVRLRKTNLRVRVFAEPADFGMGDERLPRWSEDRRVFHLYGYREPAHDERAAFRAEKLKWAERRRLWRQRAMVHAAMQRFDDDHQVSRSEDFRLATGWLIAGDRPLTHGEERLNPYSWAYSRALGMQTASLDFVTFAEEALVPPSRIAADRAEPPDDAVGCQEFSKARILKAALIKGAGGVEGTALSQTPRCPLFEQFSDIKGIDHLELLLSAPSSTSPESLFGHLLIRPVYKWELDTPSPSFEPVMEIGAFFGLNTPTVEYVWRGLTGTSTTFFAFNSMTIVLKRSLEYEQRSLTRFRLNLSPDETLRVMQRMWELERRGYFPYYFFTENCAAWMQFLLDAALDEERRIGRRGTLWVMPLATMDALSDLTSFDGKPLIEPLGQPHVPSGTVALAEDQKLAEVIAELDAAVPSVKWAELLADRGSTDGKKRRALYVALSSELTRAPKPLAQKLSRALLRIERFGADHGAAREQKVKDKARLFEGPVALPTADELLQARQKRYQRERPFERYAEESSLLLHMRTVYDALPLRPLTESEQAEVDSAVAAREAFEAAALMHASFTTPDENRALDVVESVTAKGRSLEERQRSLWGSGAHRLGVGAAGVREGDGTVRPSLYLNAAVVSELLGEPRLIGFGPEYEVRLLEARMLLGVEKSLPSLLYGDFDVVSLRALGRRPELARTGLQHHVGWGIGFSYAHRRVGPSNELHRLLIDGNVFGTTLRSVDFGRHLSLGLGAAVEVPLLPASLNTGLRTTLLARLPLPGHGVNALRAELTFSQRYGLLGPGRLEPIQEGTAALEVPVFMGEGGAPGLVLRPRAEAYARRTGDQLTVTGFVLAAGEWN